MGPRSLWLIRTHYDILGVNQDADEATIRAAYRERARHVHPDRLHSGDGSGPADEMAAVNEAYRVLSDAGRRAVYDRSLHDHTTGGTGSAVPPSNPTDDDIRSRIRARTYNYPTETTPARVPWRFLGFMATIGIGFVLAGAILIDEPAEREPDGIIRSGSCVQIEPNNDAREVRCTGEGDLVVDQLVPIDARCPAGTVAYRDRQGLGTACVVPPGGS